MWPLLGAFCAGFLLAWGLILLIGLRRLPEHDPLDALAIEVLLQTGRPFIDMATRRAMITWLRVHEYTPLSDPEEVCAQFVKEC